jgi:hypothetical protein
VRPTQSLVASLNLRLCFQLPLSPKAPGQNVPPGQDISPGVLLPASHSKQVGGAISDLIAQAVFTKCHLSIKPNGVWFPSVCALCFLTSANMCLSSSPVN